MTLVRDSAPRSEAFRAEDRAVALMMALHLEARVGSLVVARAMLDELLTRAIDGAKQGDA